jgi:hypothetical protein
MVSQESGSRRFERSVAAVYHLRATICQLGVDSVANPEGAVLRKARRWDHPEEKTGSQEEIILQYSHTLLLLIAYPMQGVRMRKASSEPDPKICRANKWSRAITPHLRRFDFILQRLPNFAARLFKD